MEKNNFNNKEVIFTKQTKSYLAYFQICLLVLGIIAFSDLVSAGNGDDDKKKNDQQTSYGSWASILGALGGGNKLGGTGAGSGNTIPYGWTRWEETPPDSKSFTMSRPTATTDKPTTIPKGKPSESKPAYTFDGGAWSLQILASSAMHAFFIGGIFYMFAGFMGMDSNEAAAWSAALTAGWFAGESVTKLYYGWKGKGSGLTAGGLGILAGTIIALAVYHFMYYQEKTSTHTGTCGIWEPPVGGKECYKCNNQNFPCSEYQCKSLGQACQLLNPETGEETCYWNDPNDVKPPVIEAWDDALTLGYKYTPDNAVSPPDRGVKIENKNAQDKCVTPFTPITFGITTSEPAKCKIDFNRTDSYDKMALPFGGSNLFLRNHSQELRLPDPNLAEQEGITIRNGNNIDLFIRCADPNGNFNIAHFIVKLCISDSPDVTAPIIESTSMISGMPVANNQSTTNLDLFVNEPAECRWSRLDQEFDKMENILTCASKVSEVNARMLYKCSTTLTGIKNEAENMYYFRCKDYSTISRNVNVESYPFKVIGTKQLAITEVRPNGTIKDASTEVRIPLEVDTSAGFREGEAICSFRQKGTTDYIDFFTTGSNKHYQDLYLTEGSYTYEIKCVDLGGNTDTKELSFYAESDSETPLIVRVYNKERQLSVTTNEEAECVYDLTSCNFLFTDGLKMSTTNKILHTAEWNTQKSFHIKCKDNYGNQPAPNSCSMIIKPFELPIN